MKIAIITAFNATAYEDFKLLYASIRMISTIPILVYDIDNLLNDEYQVTKIIHPAQEILKSHRLVETRWMQWYKPHLILNVLEQDIYDYLIWLDSDIVVLSIDHVILDTVRQFAVYADDFAPDDVKNKPTIYPHDVDKLRLGLTLNTGVLGVKCVRDYHIIKSWCAETDRILADRSLVSLITLYDQGVLLYLAVTTNLIAIIENVANNKNAKRRFYRDGLTQSDYVRLVTADHEGANIVHYAGAFKLSYLISVDHPALTSIIVKSQAPVSRTYIVTKSMSATISGILCDSCLRLTYVGPYRQRSDAYGYIYISDSIPAGVDKVYLILSSLYDLAIEMRAEINISTLTVEETLDYHRVNGNFNKINAETINAALYWLDTTLRIGQTNGIKIEIIWISDVANRRRFNDMLKDMPTISYYHARKLFLDSIGSSDDVKYCDDEHLMHEIITKYGYQLPSRSNYL